uniref:DDE_Tnp_ISL3 domain-containing protein n=1 Tax=Heterorhabditis bacteriophora TaxID=37862 RepID=A0A1I7XMU6_HETBA
MLRTIIPDVLLKGIEAWKKIKADAITPYQKQFSNNSQLAWARKAAIRKQRNVDEEGGIL